jgi:hypothetical protein
MALSHMFLLSLSRRSATLAGVARTHRLVPSGLATLDLPIGRRGLVWWVSMNLFSDAERCVEVKVST